jgi:hypothetical protein
LLPLLGQQMVSRIATRSCSAGISQESLSMFAPQIDGQWLVAGFRALVVPPRSRRSAKYNANTFPAGSSISVQLVRGDYSLAAAAR